MTLFIHHNLIFLEILSPMPQCCSNAPSVFISASCYAETLFSFPKTCGSSAVSNFRPWPNLLGFNEQSLHLWVTLTSQLLSLARFVIILSVTWPKKTTLFFFLTTNPSCSPTHTSLPTELFWTPLPSRPHTFCLQICHFILCIFQIQFIFFFFFSWLPLIYAFFRSSTCYTLFFTITSIKPLPSTPWWDLFPVLSF